MPEFVIEFGDGAAPPSDGRLYGPAFGRNHAPIWSVIAPFLAGRTGDVLEIASGTGQHVVAFARRSPAVTWWPSDINARHLASIAAWRTHENLANVREPARVDLLDAEWHATLPVRDSLLAIVGINVLHISPWHVSESLIAGARATATRRRAPVCLRPVPPRRRAHGAEQRGVRREPAGAGPGMGRARCGATLRRSPRATACGSPKRRRCRRIILRW